MKSGNLNKNRVKFASPRISGIIIDNMNNDD